jgi:predicted membrane channel-forming protein YqfA (hemolysin III family)
VVGRATSLLGERRLAAFAALGAAVGVYYVVRKDLPDLPVWWDVALLCFPIMPAVLGLLYVLLPAWRARGVVVFAVFAVLGIAATALELADDQLAGNFAKLFCFAFFGWWALRFFEELWWVALIALIVPLVDSFSVFSNAGPTHNITEHHFGSYLAVAVAFVVPNHSSAQIGPPDVIFFSLYLAAADRFRLRVAATFWAMALLLGLTIVLSVGIDVSGLPALVPLSLGFLGVNADVIWRRIRSERAAAAS